MLAVQPTSILDIGAGFGALGVLARQYTDIMRLQYDRRSWKTKIFAVDIHGAYVTPLHDYIYDEVVVADAVEFLESVLAQGSGGVVFDMVLCCDVIEHYEREAGERLLELIDECSRAAVITTPRAFFPQDALLGNEHERHRSLWSPEDFAGYRVRTVRGVKIMALKDVPMDAPWAASVGLHWDDADLQPTRS